MGFSGMDQFATNLLAGKKLGDPAKSQCGYAGRASENDRHDVTFSDSKQISLHSWSVNANDMRQEDPLLSPRAFLHFGAMRATALQLTSVWVPE